MDIWQVLINSGVSGSMLALVFLLYTFISKKKDSANKSKASNTNTINVSNSKEESTSLILKEDIKENREVLKQVSKTLNEVSWELKKLQIAMNYYVDNNGVTEDVKKHFKKILEEDRK